MLFTFLSKLFLNANSAAIKLLVLTVAIGIIRYNVIIPYYTLSVCLVLASSTSNSPLST